jgi:hypothetical protein
MTYATQRTWSTRPPQRILARALATELTGEALAATVEVGRSTYSTTLSTGNDDHEDD